MPQDAPVVFITIHINVGSAQVEKDIHLKTQRFIQTLLTTVSEIGQGHSVSFLSFCLSNQSPMISYRPHTNSVEIFSNCGQRLQPTDYKSSRL